MKCPSCGSPQISRRRTGRDTGSTIGALLGASLAAANSMRATRIGIAIGSCMGPIGSAAGGITGAVISGICTGSAVSAIGGAVGNVADREFLDNCECEACGETFRREDAFVFGHAPAGETGKSGLFSGPIVAPAGEQGGSSDGARS